VAGRTERDRVRDPDPRIVERARTGDLPAFEELVRTYQADVYRFAAHLTHDRALAEDITQETFLRAFRFLRGFRGGTTFGAWLFRIARNCSMDALRRERPTMFRPLDEPDGGQVGDAAPRVELAAALDAVSTDHRDAFLLVEVFGLTYLEASDVLGVAVGTVKSRMFRARQALAAALDERERTGEEAT
jgi:RNA polymerase sigma-70 factor (ECF subfamily)